MSTDPNTGEKIQSSSLPNMLRTRLSRTTSFSNVKQKTDDIIQNSNDSSPFEAKKSPKTERRPRARVVSESDPGKKGLLPKPLERSRSSYFAPEQGNGNNNNAKNKDGEMEEGFNNCFDYLDSLIFNDPKSNRGSLILNRFGRKSKKEKQLSMSINLAASENSKLLELTTTIINALEDVLQQIYKFFDEIFVQPTDIKLIEFRVEAFYISLKEGAGFMQSISENKKYAEIIESTVETIESADAYGIPDTNTGDSVRPERKSVINNVMKVLKRHIYQQLFIIRSFGIQFIASLSNTDILLYSTLTRSIVKLMTSTINNISTFNLIKDIHDKASNSIEFKSSASADMEEDIWNELNSKKSYPKGTGCLNSLILSLTSTTSYDNNFTKSFIMTYQAFTNPWNLFTKLKERYSVPSDIPEITQIQLRVCIVLKYWMETRIFDFDEQLLSELNALLKGPVFLDHADMCNRLLSTLETKLESYSSTFHSVTLTKFQTHLLRYYFDKRVSQSSLILDLPTATIAQQLTLRDSEAFQRIEVVGFLNLAWDKPNLKYKALSLIYFIECLNQYSFWVATLILMQSTKAKRVEMLKKLLDIANELYKLNNFHAVAGFIVGLNMAPISRLKHSLNELGKKRKAILQLLNEFMNPASSYLSYRNTLHSRTTPAVPFIGIYLSDLTFIHEGNPDYIEGFINFDKHDLVYNALREVILYQQQCRYEFQPNYLLQAFLSGLPTWDEKVMYNVSLLLEPRGAESQEIL